MKHLFCQWIKKEVVFLLRGYLPVVGVILFAMFAVSFLPEDIAIKAIGIFAVFICVVAYFLS